MSKIRLALDNMLQNRAIKPTAGGQQCGMELWRVTFTGNMESMVDEAIEQVERENAELRQQVKKMKSCNNCNHHYGEECTDPDLSELTHEEYYNGCEHWRPRDAA